MVDVTYPASTVEFVTVEVESSNLIDTQPVWIAFTPQGDHTPENWSAAEWVAAANPARARTARVKISPPPDPPVVFDPSDDAHLTRGTYWMWTKIGFSDETIVTKVAGIVRIL